MRLPTNVARPPFAHPRQQQRPTADTTGGVVACPAHRSRAGNRRINHVLYIAAVCQIRHDTPGRAYYRRKLAEGKTSLEALRCLRRRLSDVVFRQLVADAASKNTPSGRAREGTRGRL